MRKSLNCDWRASGASSFNLRVDGFEFEAGGIDAHWPVDASLTQIDVAGPYGDFARQKFDAADSAAVHALTVTQLNSFSAMLSQLLCLGVKHHSIRVTKFLALAGSNAS